MIVKQSFRFEAAHRLPQHRGKCFNLHGHSYRFTLALDLRVDPATGMTADFDEIVSVVEERVLSAWDHRNMNDFFENPTAEHMVVEIWRKVAGRLRGLTEIELWETPESSVVYRGEGEPPAGQAGSIDGGSR